MGDLGREEGGLLKRFRDLEASQEKLKEQLRLVFGEGEIFMASNSDDDGINKSIDNRRRRDYQDQHEVVIIPGYFAQSPYRSVLQQMGHAVHVCRSVTGEIIYWNRSAENLYGWKDYEAFGQRVANLLIDDEDHPFFEKIMERLNSGQTWSGKFPFRKKSGRQLMAMVTKSPLYQNNELIGVIAASSDSAILDDMIKERSRSDWNEGHDQQREPKLNFGRLRPQPDIASSVSNLAAKVFSKLNIRGSAPRFQESDNDTQTNSAKISEAASPPPILQATCTWSDGNQSRVSKDSSDDSKQVPRYAEENVLQRMMTEECCVSDSTDISKQIVKEKLTKNSIKSSQCYERGSSFEQTKVGVLNTQKNHGISSEQNWKDDAEHGSGNSIEGLPTQAVLQNEQRLRNQVEDGSPSANSAQINNQPGSSPVEKKDLDLDIECDIHWEDLHIGEEVGQGFHAVVYRGVWNGSDVAIKVYLGNDYQEGLLSDYKKEVAIMKRLRHPNVLLFMGAVYSPQRLAIVTEFLPRGSLFRTLHKNNQNLDLKRRLRMALDVARGMNYLHRRNPPIIHRDLKSSNLLVDKNWTVKVGDFGISCLKMSTFMTAASGRGTPQWMAPEVLRGDCSNEKSDVFSFGVILWELMTESVPWSHLSPFQVIGVVGFMDRRLDIPTSMDPRVSAIIHECWDSDPVMRPSFQELVGRMGELLRVIRQLPLTGGQSTRREDPCQITAEV